MSTLNVANITDGTDTVETGYVVNGSAKSALRCTLPATIYSSFNITSMTDRGTGLGQANFTSAMGDADDYGIVSGATAGAENTTFIWWEGSTQTTTYYQWTVGTSANGGTVSLINGSTATVTFGELA